MNKFLHIVSVSLLLTLNKLHTSVPHPDVFWYRLKGMGAQKNAPKKVLVTLFPLSYNYWGLSLNYPILNFKKTVCPKNVSMWHCTRLYKFEKISHIVLLSVLLTLNKFYATRYFVIVNFEQILYIALLSLLLTLNQFSILPLLLTLKKITKYTSVSIADKFLIFLYC